MGGPPAERYIVVLKKRKEKKRKEKKKSKRKKGSDERNLVYFASFWTLSTFSSTREYRGCSFSSPVSFVVASAAEFSFKILKSSKLSSSSGTFWNFSACSTASISAVTVWPRSASCEAGPMKRSLRDSLRSGARPTRCTTSSR
ncbi:Lysis DeFective 2, no significant blast hit, conidia-enriched transcript [Histoplasma capsulatum G186AR]|uniref:Lysis DeFective 2 n=1 Tax=Ajellomyces capsulatus TaxID=5037 RepID=A0A8H7YTZ2_AJECA|nr:Lysis DeFective 2 [Histoplasma capsulatum]QSS73570.1 Lysis DeFective 2, no significant blast hit, conidia-enriched transcript [Histoplasma capsulatum G186AR]